MLLSISLFILLKLKSINSATDGDNCDPDLPMSVWTEQKVSQDWSNNEERSFRVECIVPLFKSNGSCSKVIFSWYEQK
jgi:hypothetical protein